MNTANTSNNATATATTDAGNDWMSVASSYTKGAGVIVGAVAGVAIVGAASCALASVQVAIGDAILGW